MACFTYFRSHTSLRNFQEMKKHKASALAIIASGIILLWIQLNIGYWRYQDKIIAWDVIHYYSYLPATFIYNDITLNFTDNYQGKHQFLFWPEKAPNGNKIIKTTMGLAIVYMPGFLVAHALAEPLGYDAGGFSAPYRVAMQITALLVFLMGLYFLSRVLLLYFHDLAVAISLLIITFGTNLAHYVTHESGMSHHYTFAFTAAFMWLSIQWHDKQKLSTTIWLGLLSGLLVLIRPTNILVALFFILYHIRTVESITEKLKLYARKWYLLVVLLMVAFIVFIPQMWYWKKITDLWLYYSYPNENFYFNNPQIINGLFSYRKGWLIYNPVMVVAIVGMILGRRYLQVFNLFHVVFFPLSLIIIYSWWCWWYGGSFGGRAMIDIYPFLAVGLTFFIHFLFSVRGIQKVVYITLLALLTVYGVFQSAKYHYGAIHYDSMTKEAFMHTFTKLKPDGKFYELLKQPDYEKALKGIPEYE